MQDALLDEKIRQDARSMYTQCTQGEHERAAINNMKYRNAKIFTTFRCTRY